MGGSLDIMGHGCKIVTLRVPYHLADYLTKIHLDHLISLTVICLKSPLDIFFFLITGFGIKLILLLQLCETIFGLLILFLCVECSLDNVHKFLIDNSEKTVSFAWAPLNTVNHSIRKLVLPQYSRGFDVPNNYVMIFIAGCEISTTGRN